MENETSPLSISSSSSSNEIPSRTFYELANVKFKETAKTGSIFMLILSMEIDGFVAQYILHVKLHMKSINHHVLQASKRLAHRVYYSSFMTTQLATPTQVAIQQTPQESPFYLAPLDLEQDWIWKFDQVKSQKILNASYTTPPYTLLSLSGSYTVMTMDPAYKHANITQIFTRTASPNVSWSLSFVKERKVLLPDFKSSSPLGSSLSSSSKKGLIKPKPKSSPTSKSPDTISSVIPIKTSLVEKSHENKKLSSHRLLASKRERSVGGQFLPNTTTTTTGNIHNNRKRNRSSLEEHSEDIPDASLSKIYNDQSQQQQQKLQYPIAQCTQYNHERFKHILISYVMLVPNKFQLNEWYDQDLLTSLLPSSSSSSSSSSSHQSTSISSISSSSSSSSILHPLATIPVYCTLPFNTEAASSTIQVYFNEEQKPRRHQAVSLNVLQVQIPSPCELFSITDYAHLVSKGEPWTTRINVVILNGRYAHVGSIEYNFQPFLPCISSSSSSPSPILSTITVRANTSTGVDTNNNEDISNNGLNVDHGIPHAIVDHHPSHPNRVRPIKDDQEQEQFEENCRLEQEQSKRFRFEESSHTSHHDLDTILHSADSVLPNPFPNESNSTSSSWLCCLS